MAEPEKYLTNEELAERLQVSLFTVRDWRRRGVGPRAHKFGTVVRYSLADVQAWEHASREPVSA